MNILVFLLLALLVVGAIWLGVRLWNNYQKAKKVIYQYVYTQINAQQVCPDKKATKAAAQCTADALSQKYGVFNLYNKLQAGSSSVNQDLIQFGTQCVLKKCLPSPTSGTGTSGTFIPLPGPGPTIG